MGVHELGSSAVTTRAARAGPHGNKNALTNYWAKLSGTSLILPTLLAAYFEPMCNKVAKQNTRKR